MKIINSKKQTLSSKAYNYIKTLIINGELKEGDFITETKIGNELNISRTPVKHALTRLEQENYVRVIDGIGTVVVGLSVHDISDIYEVRIEIEKIALRTAIYNITEDEISRIEDKLNKIIKHKKNNKEIDNNFISEVDAEFHNLIISNSNNDYIKKLMSYIKAQITRFQQEAYILTNTSLESTKYHILILDAIRKKDLKSSQNYLEKHLQWSYEVLIKALSEI